MSRSGLRGAWLAAALLVVALAVESAASPDPVPGWDNTNDLGQTEEFLYDTFHFMGKSLHTFNKTNGFFKAFIKGFETVFIVNCTEAIRLLGEEHKLIEAAWPEEARPLLGNHGLIFSKGTRKWGRTRSIVEASLTPAILAGMVPKLVKRVSSHTSAWAKSTTPVHPYPLTRALVFDAILEMIFGKTWTKEQYDELHVLYNIIDEGALTISLDSPQTTWGQALRANFKIRTIFAPEVWKKIEDVNNGVPENPPTILGGAIKAMLDEGVTVEELNLNFDEVMDTAVGYFFGGYLTASQTIARVMWELPKHPSFWEKVVEEQANLIKKFGKNIDTLEQLNSMPYLDALIKESVRVMPPVGAVFRQALVDFEAGGYTIKKGQHIIPMIGPACNNPYFYPNTAPTDNEEYKPERWIGAPGSCADSKTAKTAETAKIEGGCPVKHDAKEAAPAVPEGCPNLVPNPPAMMTFGYGVRQCPGRYFATSIMKSALATIVRSATWERAVDIPIYIYPEAAKAATLSFTPRTVSAGKTARACPGISFWPPRPSKHATDAPPEQATTAW